VNELRRYLDRTEMANGFGNRFMWLWVERARLLPLDKAVDEEAMDAIKEELRAALAFAKTAERMKRDAAADQLWVDVYPRLSADLTGIAGEMQARGEPHVMRLAMLYALLDRTATILPVHLYAAMALYEHSARTVNYVFGDSLGDQTADSILCLLRGTEGGCTRNDILEHFQRNISSPRIGRALEMLVEHDLAYSVRVATGGRPADKWFAADSPLSSSTSFTSYPETWEDEARAPVVPQHDPPSEATLSSSTSFTSCQGPSPASSNGSDRDDELNTTSPAAGEGQGHEVNEVNEKSPPAATPDINPVILTPKDLTSEDFKSSVVPSEGPAILKFTGRKGADL
jgi:hypothetical protein